jgi:glycine/D-amino acid oxidase-like deaminating enzyme
VRENGEWKGNTVKVVVVGAGAIGACVAYRLAREGAEVTLLDGANPAESLSAHSFGWVNAVVDGSAPYYDLTHAGLTAHGRLAGELPGEPWFW